MLVDTIGRTKKTSMEQKDERVEMEDHQGNVISHVRTGTIDPRG